ncbi:MAG TPA: hypothetical protein VL307_00250, partial [Chitinophagaceae bacterium]|nr:hypothetical protein [Chitinophagaceae bacterium]
MDYKIEEVKILDKLEELGLALPSGLTFFPENLEVVTNKKDFIFTDSLLDVNKIFSKNNISIATLGGDSDLYRSRKNADIYLPAIFFSLSLISENSSIISISLNVLSNYISDFLKGSFGKNRSHLDFYVEKEKGKVKKISYNG